MGFSKNVAIHNPNKIKKKARIRRSGAYGRSYRKGWNGRYLGFDWAPPEVGFAGGKSGVNPLI
jgi:hypothetical protein